MGKLRQILTDLSAFFHFPDDNLSRCQGILTKLGTCIDKGDLVWDCLWANFVNVLTELSACNTILAGYYSLTFLLHLGSWPIQMNFL